MSLSSHSVESSSTTYSDNDTPSPPNLTLPQSSNDFTHEDVPDSERQEIGDQIGTQSWDQVLPQPGSSSMDPEAQLEAQRLSVIAADRKRRLTDSQHGPNRRRTSSGGFHTQEDGMDSASSSAAVQAQMSSPSQSALMRNMGVYRPDSMEPPLPPVPARRPSESSDYTLPKWQPDSEVSDCPICGAHFTWYFRKHHCRKCGRVVCANCSPHRITIPRQFIVHPPDPNYRSSTYYPTTPTNVIDLTRDDDSVEPSSDFQPSRRPGSSQYSNPALGGGEEVRLCNPCVPDPQPNPQPNFNAPIRSGPGARWSTGPDFRSGWEAFQQQNAYPREIQTGAWATEQQARQEYRRQRGQSLGYQRENQRLPPDPPTENLPGYSQYDYRNNHEAGPQNYPPNATIQGSTMFRNSMPIGGFAHQSGRRTNEPPRVPRGYAEYVGGRPRVQSMLESSSRSSSSMDTSRAPRPRLHERDICPICRHALPPTGVNGDETVRERHIMECIASRDPTYIVESPPGQEADPGAPSSSTSPPRLHIPAPVYMLRFNATEKDCTLEDGSVQECSICMVEYEVGEKLVRLECLCKFHEECITGWFRRKRECPVHKRDEREAV